MRAVGDSYSPGTIAAAVWDGRRYAEEFDAEPADPDEAALLREVADCHRTRCAARSSRPAPPLG